MAKVLGVGGVFFKASDPDALRQWYARVLGLEFADWGGVWFPADAFAALDTGTSPPDRAASPRSFASSDFLETP